MAVEVYRKAKLTSVGYLRYHFKADGGEEFHLKATGGKKEAVAHLVNAGWKPIQRMQSDPLEFVYSPNAEVEVE